MIYMSLAEIAAHVNGQLLGQDMSIHGVSHDSRKCLEGSLFVAIRGERYDGHQFINDNLKAAAFLVEYPVCDQRPMIVVENTPKALSILAAQWRRQCPALVIALTGSNGKTTTKEMLRSILSCHHRVHATAGNLNNHIGVPLTLLSLPTDARYAVIEMGANHAGEIAGLTRCAQPDIALITNAGRAHLEGFGSLEGVARAKGEIYSGLVDKGIAIVNRDDRFSQYWSELNTHRRQISFSLDVNSPTDDVEVFGQWIPPDQLKLNWQEGTIVLRLNAPGRHLAQNATAAAAVALSAGCDLGTVQEGLQRWIPFTSRMRPLTHISGALIWDDSYNANPDSLLAGLQVLVSSPGEHILVLGDMLELGSEAASVHEEMGRLARNQGVSRLLAVGPLCQHAVEGFGEGGQWFFDHRSLAEVLIKNLRSGISVLVKGSRGQQMEKVIEFLQIQSQGASNVTSVD